MLRKFLLICGVLSSLWYVVINIVVPLQYPGYNMGSQTISELSAIDAPTRPMWTMLCIPYSLLLIAFGAGIWLAADHNKMLRLAAAVIVFDAVFGFFWPPMHQREVIAAGGGTLSDTLHLAWTFVHLVLILLMIGLGAAALGKRFRIYSIATVLVFIVFGILTSQESSRIETAEPTPYLGIWERITIAAYMIWIIALAISCLKSSKKTPRKTDTSNRK